jgi:hypothetical protein
MSLEERNYTPALMYGAENSTNQSVITSASANAFAVGRQGSTSPALKVDASTASSATGLEVIAAASGSGVAVRAIGGTNEALTINAKGTGTIGIGSVSTGAVTITPATTVTGLLTATAGVLTKQAVTNVHDTTPTQAEMVTAFGAVPGRGFIGTIDDNDGNAVSYLCWSTDASYFFVAGTKGA